MNKLAILGLGLAVSLLLVSNDNAEAKSVKYKDLAPEHQTIVMTEMQKMTKEELIARYLKKATPKELLEIIDGSKQIASTN